MKVFLKTGQVALLAIFLIMAAAVIIFGLYNFSKTGTIFGNSQYKQVELAQLLSFGNFYDGKKICTRGYYIKNSRLSIIKVSLAEDEFTRSAWVKLPSGEILSVNNHYLEAELCGLFESRRGPEFGDRSVWIHQITVEKYKPYSAPGEISLP